MVDFGIAGKSGNPDIIIAADNKRRLVNVYKSGCSPNKLGEQPERL
ncbi:hypothetical protein ACFL0H_13310 [Thermodesulfobacteriota bacterium]